jgi:acyl carrier protein
VREQIINALGLRPSMELKLDQGLTDLGMDSLIAVEISNRLKRSLGCSLPLPLAFEYPMLEALTDYLARRYYKSNQTATGERKLIMKRLVNYK